MSRCAWVVDRSGRSQTCMSSISFCIGRELSVPGVDVWLSDNRRFNRVIVREVGWTLAPARNGANIQPETIQRASDAMIDDVRDTPGLSIAGRKTPVADPSAFRHREHVADVNPVQ